MHRFRQTEEILKAMRQKENIRNVGVIAHIDHGKTTLTDSLLAEAGLIPRQIAGTARVLDYLEEEQKRGITIKTANISLLYRTRNNNYVINLIDTPGHVDFAGKVTRALRAIDGVIVVVDAVEEIMTQTQTVTRQALEERVKPILFINKVDRLIGEMRLSEKDILSKFTRIINNFNSIIEIYGEKEFKDKWKVDPTKETVVFGSALEKWGFTLKIADEKNIKFSEIEAACSEHEPDKLQELIPLHKAILEAIVGNLPNPVNAQKYRIQKIWRGKISSEVGQAMLNCNNDAPTVICVTNVQTGTSSELTATGRIFAGSVTPSDVVYLVNAEKECEVKQISLFMGAFRDAVNRITVGNIVALTGLDMCRAGETVVSPKYKVGMVPFELTKSVSEPVMTIAVEPENPNDLPCMVEAMEKLSAADPNIVSNVNQETGEYLLSGIGELHLEIALKSLSQISGITQLDASPPMINYRESVKRKGAIATAANKHRTVALALRAQPAGQIEDERENGQLWFKDDQNNMLVSRLNANDPDLPKNSIITSFRSLGKNGPLCGEPLRNVKICLIEATIIYQLGNPDEVATTMRKAAYGTILTAEPVLLEPVYRIEITAPTELLGKCIKTLKLKRGKISGTEQKGSLTVIIGHIPAAETFGLATELRSSTSGQAFWQCTLESWQKIPEEKARILIKQIRQRKGLPPEIPKPDTFALIK